MHGGPIEPAAVACITLIVSTASTRAASPYAGRFAPFLIG